LYILFKVAALILIGNLKYKVYTLVRVSRAEEIHIYVVRGFFGKKDWSARGGAPREMMETARNLSSFS